MVVLFSANVFKIAQKEYDLVSLHGRKESYGIILKTGAGVKYGNNPEHSVRCYFY